MVIRFGSGVLRNQSEQASASPVLARAKHDQGRRLLCCLLLFELRTRRAMRRPTKHGPYPRRSRSGRYLLRLALVWCDYSTCLVERNCPVVGGCVVGCGWAVLLEARRATAPLAANSPFRSSSALPPQLFHITSAAVPHYLSSSFALLPNCFRTASALVSYCFRTASELLPPYWRNGSPPPSAIDGAAPSVPLGSRCDPTELARRACSDEAGLLRGGELGRSRRASCGC